VRSALEGQGVVIRTHQESDPPFPGEALHLIEGGAIRSLAQLTPRAVLDQARVPFPLALRVSALLASMGRWSGPLVADVEDLARVVGAAFPAGTTPPASKLPEGRLPPGLSMTGIRWSPDGGRGAPVVEGVDFAIGGGRIGAILGRSGTGKSTLLKLAAGVLRPTQGSIHVPAPSVPRVRSVALALEYPERQLFGRTVLEDVSALLWIEGIPAEERARSARRAMVEVGLDPACFEDRFPITLSEGEKRRAALAGVLIEPPQLLLLDEPTAGLDPEGRRALAQVLRGLRERGRTVLLASHDLSFVASVADLVVVLGRDPSGVGPGRQLATGEPARVLRDETLMREAGLPVPDFIRLDNLLCDAGLLGAGRVWDEESLLEALARGGSAKGLQPT
jgi:energy-coupling factor transporter ATP-binding protein EcfA2